MADIAAVTSGGTSIRVPSAPVDEFGSGLRGRLLSSRDPGFDAARELWNGMIARHPALIARCVDENDVVRSVNFAHEHELLVAVRGGGHGVEGHSLCDGGLVIDLSEMRGIDVDSEGRTARAGGYCTLGDLDRATQRYGLATPLGW